MSSYPDSEAHCEQTSSAAGATGRGRWPLLGLCSLGALALVPLGQVYVGFGAVGTILAAVAGAIGTRIRDWTTVRVASMTLLIALTGVIGVPFGIWFVVGLIWLASRRLPQLAPDTGWLAPGRATPVVWWLAGMVVVAAGIGLTLWARWTDQFGESTMELVEAARRLPGAALAVSVIAFVVVNATCEEIAYRGIAFEAAIAFLPPMGAVAAQGVAFATLHVAGFPAGPVGVGLALGYGLVLGTIRQVTGGLRFPIVAHMAADATIAVLVIALLLPG